VFLSFPLVFCLLRRLLYFCNTSFALYFATNIVLSYCCLQSFRQIYFVDGVASESRAMDPLSVSASIAGLITIADVIVRNGYKFLKQVKHSEKTVSTLISEVNHLSGTLYSLRNVAQRFEMDTMAFEPATQIRYIDFCYQTLETIRITLENANPAGSKGSVGSLSRKLRWPLSASETEALVTDVKRHISTLHLALSADGM